MALTYNKNGITKLVALMSLSYIQKVHGSNLHHCTSYHEPDVLFFPRHGRFLPYSFQFTVHNHPLILVKDE